MRNQLINYCFSAASLRHFRDGKVNQGRKRLTGHWAAGNRQIRDAIRSASRTRSEMLDFKKFVTRRASPLIGALMAELEQQIFFQFVAGQFALLRFDAFD